MVKTMNVSKQSLRGRLGRWYSQKLSIPTAYDYTKKIIDTGDCQIALDIGCGVSSRLSGFRPGIKTIGIDADPVSIKAAKKRNVHDDYLLTNIIKVSSKELLSMVHEDLRVSRNSF